MHETELSWSSSLFEKQHTAFCILRPFKTVPSIVIFSLSWPERLQVLKGQNLFCTVCSPTTPRIVLSEGYNCADTPDLNWKDVFHRTNLQSFCYLLWSLQPLFSIPVSKHKHSPQPIIHSDQKREVATTRKVSTPCPHPHRKTIFWFLWILWASPGAAHHFLPKGHTLKQHVPPPLSRTYTQGLFLPNKNIPLLSAISSETCLVF